ncbi:MAG TPA: hypothetical protein DDY37_06170, partial [Legionella sp.]|nr:hypothetical protein [Legionella sp.]
MPIPLIIKGALIAKAAHSGAKAGAKEALEETAAANKPEQPLSPPALTATSAYHMQASVSISTQKKEAIDLLLKVQRYLVLVQLRDRITKDRINVDFYSLFLQKQGLIEFLQQHPRIAHLFLDQVQNCIGSFFEDLDRVISSPKEPTLVPRQVNRPGADLSEADKKARRLRYKLLNIESCPHSEKMRLLQERDSDDQNSIGHLCLGLNYELRRRYADILQSLEPNALFIILKLSNRQKASIYSLYYASGLDLCALISNCQDDPNVFCDILEHFTIDIQTIQSLVNIYGLKEK